MTYTGGFHADEHFTGAGIGNADIFDHEWFSGFVEDGGGCDGHGRQRAGDAPSVLHLRCE